MSGLRLRRAGVAAIPALRRIRLGSAASTRAGRFHAARGWTRADMKVNIEVGYRLRRTDGHAGKAA